MALYPAMKWLKSANPPAVIPDPASVRLDMMDSRLSMMIDDTVHILIVIPERNVPADSTVPGQRLNVVQPTYKDGDYAIAGLQVACKKIHFPIEIATLCLYYYKQFNLFTYVGILSIY